MGRLSEVMNYALHGRLSDSAMKALLLEMDELKRKHMSCRSHFPYMPETCIGMQRGNTAPLYQSQGYIVEFSFKHRITAEDVRSINGVGHYMNQNFIVRFCALLESYHVLSNGVTIDKSLPGGTELSLLKQLRNVIAHSGGHYDAANGNHRSLRKKLIKHFELADVTGSEFPLPIDYVILPMFEKCKEYVQHLPSGKTLDFALCHRLHRIIDDTCKPLLCWIDRHRGRRQRR